MVESKAGAIKTRKLRREVIFLHRVNRSVFRYVEHELYCYHQTKKEIEDIRESIVEGTSKPECGGQKSDSVSDTTGSKVTKLLSSAALLRMERVVNAIDTSLDILGEQHQRFFHAKYQQRQTAVKICINMHFSESTFYRYRRDLVDMVAQQLGFLTER